MSEPREERRAFDMAKRIREHGPDSLAGMPSEQIAGMLEEVAAEARYLRRTRRAVIEKLEQARTAPEPDEGEGEHEGYRRHAESKLNDAVSLHETVPITPTEAEALLGYVDRLRDRIQGEEQDDARAHAD